MVAREDIAGEPPWARERPNRAQKRAKFAHVEAGTESENEIVSRSASPQTNGKGEGPATPLQSVVPKRKRQVRRKSNAKEGTEATETEVELIEVSKRPIGEQSTERREEVHQDLQDPPKIANRKRETKEEAETKVMPLAARSLNTRMLIGAHVSAAKGVHNAVSNCVQIGGNAFALFLKSQRKWENPPLQDEHRKQLKTLCLQHKYDPQSQILPHGSYLVNLAQEDPTKAKQSYDNFLDDLHRCEALGIGLYNFHPGTTGPSERKPAIARIASQLNASHAATSIVTPLLETMAGGGTVIGSSFSDLAEIIALVDDKSRIGVCLDTCHVFAAGYDLRSAEAFNSTLAQFDAEIGLSYLKAVHLNDSKAPLSSRLDRHANIGTGFLGLGAFWNLVNDPRFEGLPLVLETPAEDAAGKDDRSIYAREIKLLESLIGMDRHGEEFRALEAELARKGEVERTVALEKFEMKESKAAKAKVKAKEKEKKTVVKDSRPRVRAKSKS